MPKFLALASYTSEGIKGLTRAGGTARRAVADKLLKSLGGRLDGIYFAFGENAAYVIFDVPDNSTAAAISLAVAETGVIRIQTIVLLTPEEMDQAMKKPVITSRRGRRHAKTPTLERENLGQFHS